MVRASTKSERYRGRISEYRRELGLDFSVGIAKLAGSSNDWKHDGSCREVIVSDDARYGDFPAVKQHVPDSTKVRATIRRSCLGWIAERTRGGADATRPASNRSILVAQIVAEDVSVPDPVVGAGFIDIGVEPDGTRARMIACEHDRLSVGISAIIRLPGTGNCGHCQGEQQSKHSYVVWHDCDSPYDLANGDDALYGRETAIEEGSARGTSTTQAAKTFSAFGSAFASPPADTTKDAGKKATSSNHLPVQSHFDIGSFSFCLILIL